jgi:hypothetical protein
MKISVSWSFFCAASLATFLVGCDDSPGKKGDAGPDSILVTDPDAEAPVPDAVLPDADQDKDASPGGSDGTASDANLNGDAGLDSADATASDAGLDLDAGPAPSTATVILLPDTQYYTSTFAGLDIFAKQTRWILQQTAPRRIAAVLHVGDLIDYGDVKTDVGQDGQWQMASSAMRLLDGVVPYVLCSGNHDETSERQGLMGKYFNLSSMPWLQGAIAPDRVSDSYAVVSVGPQRWLLLSLEFSPRDAALTWADGVLKAHADLPAMIVTHAYLYPDSTRYDYATYGASQLFYPQLYGFTPDQGMNDGEQIWRKLVVPNPNVRLVFSGHVNALGAHLTSTRPDGSRVHQVLSDFQWLNTNTPEDRGGDGYLEIMEFDYLQKQIRVQTYSPTQNAFIHGEASEYTLSLEL